MQTTTKNEMNSKTVDDQILAIAARRTVYTTEVARSLGIERKDAAKAIRRLRKARLLYLSEPSSASYWGAVDAGYRAA